MYNDHTTASEFVPTRTFSISAINKQTNKQTHKKRVPLANIGKVSLIYHFPGTKLYAAIQNNNTIKLLNHFFKQKMEVKVRQDQTTP